MSAPEPKPSLPSAVGMERSALSCFLQSPDFAGPILCELLTAEDFSLEPHVVAFDVLASFLTSGQPIDVSTFTQAIVDRGLMKHFGSLADISDIYTAVPDPLHVRSYAQSVREKSQQRQFIRACWDATEKVMTDCPDQAAFRAILEDVSNDMLRLQNIAQHSRKGQRTGEEVLVDVSTTLAARFNNRGRILGLATGYSDIDRTINGFQRGDFVTIGARPAMGKTSLAAGFAESIAVDAVNQSNVPVLMFTLEMSDEQIMERSIMGRAKCGLNKARTGMFNRAEGSVWRIAARVLKENKGKPGAEIAKQLKFAAIDEMEAWMKKKMERNGGQPVMDRGQMADSMADMQALCDAVGALAGGKLSFYDSYGCTSMEIRSQIRSWVRKIGWDPTDPRQIPPLVIIDYIQLVKASSRKAKGDPRLTVNETCEVLKGCAKEFGIVVMPLAQVGRSSEENSGNVPALKDLKESGAIEEFSDIVAFIHRPSYYRHWDKLKEDLQDKWNGWADARNTSPVRSELGEAVWTGQTLYEADAVFSIGKGRNCATANIPILFDGPMVRFRSKTPALFSNNKAKRQETPDPEHLFD